MSQFNYNNHRLTIENIPVIKVVKKNETPFYLYSKKQILENLKNFRKTFLQSKPLVCFSVKSNSNLSILKVLKEQQCGADVVSAGELLKVLKAGIKPNKIVFSGVGKSETELRLAIKKNILLINVESENEAKLINKISKKMKKKTSIGIRLNPDIDAKTHRKISTGKAQDKFGVSINDLIHLSKNLNKYKNLKLDAISVHIGSQILSENPFRKTLKVLGKIIQSLNLHLKFVDLGGGFGISYEKKEKKFNLKNYARAVNKFKKKFRCNIIFEPGRTILGNAGILVSKIQYLKKGKNKVFAILDAGMNDFMRPALYNASHNILPLVKNNFRSKYSIEFVGPICETTCKFIKYKKYQKLFENDYVAIMNVGAYGSTLSSNYNIKPLAAEVIIDKKKIKIIRKKQSLLKLVNI